MPSIAIPLSLRGQLLNSVRAVAFTPTSLFAASEPGVWYDPSDLTTLFQDTAGTLPVTTPGQTVALALDKSKGLVLGSELVTNGTFDSGTTGWVAGFGLVNGTFAASAGVATLTQGSSDTSPRFVTTMTGLIVGNSYRLNFTSFGQSGSGDKYVVWTNASNGTGGTTLNQGGAINWGGQNRTFLVTATATTMYVAVGLVSGTTGSSVSIDNISVKELPGFHATQATTASRPIYGINPVGGRRNLLLASDDLAAAQWNVASNLTRTVGGGGTSSSGSAYTRLTATAGNTDHYLQGAGLALTSGQTYALSFEVQYVSHRWVGISVFDGGFKNGATFDLLNGAVGSNLGNFGSRTITPLGSNRYRISGVYTAVSTANAFFGIVMLDADKVFTTTTVSNLTATIVDAGRAQFEVGSTATAYQKVTTQYDVTEAGVASVSYLAFDGVDDWLVTPTITPGIDRAQVFAGVRKNSDATFGVIVESSTNADATNGAINLYGQNAAGFAGQSRGTSVATLPAAGPASPASSVLTMTTDIAGDLARLRLNGTQASQVTTDQGTGNFLAYPLYIGRRGGTVLPLNGNIYSLIVRFGTNLITDTITSTETWVAGQTGIANWANLISPTIFARDETAVLDRFNQTIERRAV